MRALCVLLFALLTSAVPALAEKRLALVIGNGAYQHAAALANPVNDARAIAASLQDAGFEVVLGLDLTRTDFDRTLREFASKLTGADVALLFYAGHGLQVAGRNYLMPVDAKLGSERDLDFETIRLEFVLGQMELERDGKTTLVFLDACRDNPLARNLARSMGTRSAALGRGLAQVQSGVGTFIAFSTQPGNVAVDGAAGNSPFAEALARHAREQGRNLNAVMINVRRDVIKATDGRQVPWDHSSLTGDFYFKPPAGGVSALAPASKPAGQDVAALTTRLRQLEQQMRQRADASADGRARDLKDADRRLADLERQQRKDQDTIFKIQRKSIAEKDPRARIEITRELHDVMREMGRRGQEIKGVRAEIAALKPDGDKPVAAPSSEKAVAGASSCTVLGTRVSEPLALSAGAEFCNGDKSKRARVVRIADNVIVFVQNENREFSCRASDVCQFDWPGAPVFTVRAKADAARGIAPEGAMLPRPR